MELTHAGPCANLGSGRCKRFSAFVDEGIVKVCNVAEAEDDPAGDARPEVSCVEQVVHACGTIMAGGGLGDMSTGVSTLLQHA